jgi:hypothetical protein
VSRDQNAAASTMAAGLGREGQALAADAPTGDDAVSPGTGSPIRHPRAVRRY